MSTNIRVKFRTHQENAFLFMANGRTDYCLMRLEAGAISFTYKIERNVVQVRLTEIAWINRRFLSNCDFFSSNTNIYNFYDFICTNLLFSCLFFSFSLVAFS